MSDNSYTHNEIGRRLKALGYKIGTSDGTSCVKSSDGKRVLAKLPKQEPVPISLLTPILKDLGVQPKQWNGSTETHGRTTDTQSDVLTQTTTVDSDCPPFINWYLRSETLCGDMWRGNRYEFSSVPLNALKFNPADYRAKIAGPAGDSLGVFYLDEENIDRYFLSKFSSYIDTIKQKAQTRSAT